MKGQRETPNIQMQKTGSEVRSYAEISARF
jgi:hypothetical protein